jgi:hypothetical protein
MLVIPSNKVVDKKRIGTWKQGVEEEKMNSGSLTLKIKLKIKRVSQK